MKRSICLFFLFPALLITSCSQGESLWALLRRPPLPSWILSIDDTTDTTMLHLVIDESVIWETGDDGIKLEKQIDATLQVQIDNAVLSREDLFALGQFKPPIYVYDSQGNVLGSHYGRFNLIIFLPEIEAKGLHQAAIQMTSTSGIVYTYSWYFEAGENIPTSTLVN